MTAYDVREAGIRVNGVVPENTAFSQKVAGDAHDHASPRLDVGRPFAVDISGVAEAALPHAERLVRDWLPAGRREGREWVCRNPTRGDDSPGSFKVNVGTGAWADFATDDRGGDLVALRAYLDGVSQFEAARRVAAEIGLDGDTTPKPQGWAGKPLAPSRQGKQGDNGRDAPEPSRADFRHVTLGRPSERWPLWAYHHADGTLSHYRVRYDKPDGGKDVLPWRWNGAAWKCEEPKGDKFPLYSLADMTERAAAPVLVVEGEKAADAATTLVPAHVVVTSAGGSHQAMKTDWSSLKGRAVVIWPDHDTSGSKYADEVARLAHEARAASVAIVTIPEKWPAKWDVADTLPEGATADDLARMVAAAAPWQPQPAPGTGADEGRRVDADAAEIDRLARLKELDYERARSDAAAALGIGRVAMLDRLVSVRRKEFAKERAEADEAAAAGEPWPEPVDGAALLTELRERIARHAVLPEHGAATVAAWCVLAHGFDAFRVVPMLAFESPEPGCGKSTLMEIVSHLAPTPILASNISPAALFRVIDLKKPTLLIDEADTFVTLNDELRGVLNSGHARSTAYVWRCEGEGADLAPRQFSTWCPKAVALIGELPATLQARSIVIRLRRKFASETVAKIKVADEAAFLELRRKLARWVADHAAELANAEPKMPAGLANRVEDNWAPLVAIADAAGGDWPKAIREAAVAAVGLAAEFDEPSAAVRLLSDMRGVFNQHGKRIGSQAMVNHLVQIEDAPWASWSNGKTITPRRVVTLLKDFGVKPRQDRFGSHWRILDFADAWSRYLPSSDTQSASPCPQSAIVPQNQQPRAFPAIQSATHQPMPWHFESAETPANSGLRGTMALPMGEEADSRAKWVNGTHFTGGANIGEDATAGPGKHG